MRIVAGEFGGRPLKTLSGQTTRPTSDKVKGAIYNMIGPYFDGGRALDLYSGSGSLAIEAVSRGIASASLVEKDRQAQAVIMANIAMTKAPERFELLRMPAQKALTKLSGHFDLVLLDPPYAKAAIQTDIEHLLDLGLIDHTSRIVCETDKDYQLPPTIGPFRQVKQKQYGISLITLYQS